MKQANYFEKGENSTVICTLCPHGCRISEGKRGLCGARINCSGNLYAATHNEVVALNIDPIEKKPLFHFLPGSKTLSLGAAGCNLKCLFCQNSSISQVYSGEILAHKVSAMELVNKALKNRCQSISFTYSEPIVSFEMVLETAVEAKRNGLLTVLVSNGFINPAPFTELAPFIDAANIDLKGFSEAFYHEYTGGSLRPVLDTLLSIKKRQIHMEITNLIIPQVNDDIGEIDALIEWVIKNLGVDVPLHFSRFFPSFKLLGHKPTPPELVLSICNRAKERGMNFVYAGNMHNSEYDNTVCPRCLSTSVSRSGYCIESISMVDGKCRNCGKEIYGKWEKRA